MLLTKLATRHLMFSLNAASGKDNYSIYEYLYDPSALRNTILLAKEVASKRVPDKFYNIVVRALDELYAITERLEREISNRSPIILALSEKAIESIIQGSDEVLARYISSNFAEVAKILPFHIVTDDNIYFLVSPKKSDLSRLAYELGATSRTEAVNILSSEVAGNSYFKLMLYKHASKVVDIDLHESKVRVGGREFNLSASEMTKLLAALNKRKELLEYIQNTYNPWFLRALSTVLDAKIQVTGVEVDEVEHKARVNVSSDGQTKYGIPLEATIKYEKGLPSSIDIYFKYGNMRLYYKSIRTRADTLFSDIVNTLASSEVGEHYRVFRNAIDYLESHGYKVTSVCTVDNAISITATKGESIEVDCHISLGGKTEDYINLVVKAPKPATDVHMNQDETYTVGNSKVFLYVGNGKIDIRAYGAKLDLLPELEKMASAKIAEISRSWREKYDKLAEKDALVLYIMYNFCYPRPKKELVSKVGVSPSMLALKAIKLLKDNDTPPRLLATSAERLYDKGIIRIDADGYVVVLDRRLVDISKQYFGTEKIALNAEKRILASLILNNNSVLKLFDNKRVPSRVVQFLLSESRKTTVLPDSKQYIFEIAGDRDAWSQLKDSDKYGILQVLGEELLKMALTNNWYWILGDKRLKIIAEVAVLNSPSEITRHLAEHFPEELGYGYELINTGNEYFIKHQRTHLQVRKVLHDGYLFQGTIIGNKVGMLVKARDVNEASQLIQDTIVDAVIEFRNATTRLKIPNVTVQTGKYETSLFSIPYIVITDGRRRVQLPLQPRFGEKLNTVLKKLGYINDKEKEENKELELA